MSFHHLLVSGAAPSSVSAADEPFSFVGKEVSPMGVYYSSYERFLRISAVFSCKITIFMDFTKDFCGFPQFSLAKLLFLWILRKIFADFNNFPVISYNYILIYICRYVYT